ncbi:MAG TPA: hypothetical protein VFV65_03470 [Gemmatimonadales bacterium]|nr:hypothetical protein [Gemmatimonadales bacterium]
MTARRIQGLALLATLAALPASAQSGREHFIQPDTALDAPHAVQQTAFLVLRDSTSTIAAAGARLMSDMTPNSSLAWMQGRAGSVAEACARSVAPLAEARKVTAAGEWPRDNQRKAQADLLKEMTKFSEELGDCQTRWKALAAEKDRDTLRENAPYQMKQLRDRLDQFNRVAGTYLRYISVKLPPPGAARP